MTKKDLKGFLLRNDGWLLAKGETWDIKSKYLGAGVYKVYLQKHNLTGYRALIEKLGLRK